MSRQEQKVKEGIAPFLDEGEEALAAIIARPRGWTQSHQGLIPMQLGLSKQAKSREAADTSGFALASPMSLVVTQRRLLSFSIGSPIGLGMGGDVKELVGAVGLEEVDSIESKRLLAGKVVKLKVRGGDEIKLEVNAAADVKGLIEAFEASRATA
jgi:hypothetical protein